MKSFDIIKKKLQTDEGIKQLQAVVKLDLFRHRLYKMNCDLGLVN